MMRCITNCTQDPCVFLSWVNPQGA